jgi:hypothetical protein
VEVEKEWELQIIMELLEVQEVVDGQLVMLD